MVARSNAPTVFDFASELAKPEAMSDKISRLESAMRLMPQPTGMVTTHAFVPGMYCRKVFRKAGTVVVGKVHKAPHFFMCAAGELRVLHDGGKRILKAGDVIECGPGTKRVTVALSDSVGVTIHKTDKTDLDEIEAELIEPDELALYDAHNNIRVALEEKS
jgi:quercetin dioxygenase-like cupin family protein